MEDVCGRREGSEGGEEGGGKTRGRRNGRREAGVVSLQSRYNRPLVLAVCLISLSHVRQRTAWHVPREPFSRESVSAFEGAFRGSIVVHFGSTAPT